MQLHDVDRGINELAGNDWTNDEDQEEEEQREEHDRVANHASLPELGLLERVDRRANLATKSNVSTNNSRHDRNENTWGVAKRA